MHGRGPTLIILLLALSLATAAAEPTPILPSSSRGRAATIERWRSLLAEGERLRAAGDVVAAETALRAVLDESRENGGGLLRARALDALADLKRVGGEPGEAEPLYRAAAKLWRTLLRGPQPRLAVTLHNLGVVRMELGRWDEARAALEEANALWRDTAEPAAARAEVTRNALRVLERRAAAATASR